jgi:hypothetical protein
MMKVAIASDIKNKAYSVDETKYVERELTVPHI